jgi:hypothetical protein
VDIIRYSKKLEQLATVYHGDFSLIGDPLVADGTLYFYAHDTTSTTPGYVIAAGSHNWTVSYCPYSGVGGGFNDFSPVSPIVLSADGAALYAVCTAASPRTANMILKLDAASGNTLASTPYQPNATAPLLDTQGRLYLGFALSNGGGGFDVFDASLKPVASSPGDFTTGHAVLLRNGDILKRSAGFPTAVLSRRGITNWDVNVGGLSRVPTSDDQGTIYVSPVNNQLKALRPDGSTLSTYQMANGFTVQPVISNDGTLYVTSGFLSTLYAFRDGPLTTGTISVSTNLSNATFTISGPVTYTGSGTLFFQPNAPIGTYTITYGGRAGFDTPPSQILTLAAGEAIAFSGSYTPSVLPAPSVPGAVIRVDQTIMNFTYERGQAAPPPQILAVSSDRPASLSVTVLSTGWLTISSKAAVTPAQVSVAVDPARIDPGHYSGALIVGGVSVAVNLYVYDPPRLLLSTQSLYFSYQIGGTLPPSQTVYVNSTTRHVEVAAKYSDGWMTVSPDKGTTWQAFTISAHPTGLMSGTYIGSIALASQDATNSPQAVTVILHVADAP